MSFPRRPLAAGLALGFTLAFSGLPAWADETAELKKEISDLKTRLNQLERRLSDQEARAAEAPKVVTASGQEIPSWVRDVNLSGFVDASYVYNTQRPKNRANSLRVFDTEANGFQPHALEIVLQKPVSEESRVGFRTDLDFGEDAEVVGAVTTGLGSTTDEVDLQQAYAEALFPVGSGLNVKFGKFVTLHGAEVIESKDNWNFSRSILFGYAIPFTHTGLRMSYQLAPWLSTYFGVNQGWDVVDDNNTGKSLEWQVAATPTEKTFLSVAGMHGPEQANDNRDDRHLLDVVLGYNPTEKLALKLNYDYGQEQDAVSESPGENASWHGVAGYARYQVNDWYALAARAEYFADFDGIRTAVRTNNNVTDLRWWELTLTNEFKVFKDLITRLEYRHDQASDAVFNAGSSTDNSQDTISLEVIYPF
ncbi:MAG: outer membrane beta-barrel protein [Candidatus Omnitrophica bacterium]|nr:outer membrane beta-barrel protein [Candidatus Omnitrophota bacterium]